MKKVVFSIIGGSGSGKDTQAGLLSKHYDIPHLSMGGIMREQEKAGNPLALEAVRILNKGVWVPDEITSSILEDYVKRNAPDGFIITGYPRPPEQCISLERITNDMGLEVKAVIHIEVPDEILLERMHRQMSEESIGGSRGDMTEEAMHNRLKSYHDTIKPIIEFYSERDLLLNVDGTPTVEEVFDSIVNGLEKMNARSIDS